MKSRRLSAERVRTALNEDVVGVLSSFGLKYQRSGAELRVHWCPRCGQRSGPSVGINSRSGLWCCYVCMKGGDILDLIAGYSGLDVRRDFQRVLGLGAEITGLTSTGDGDVARHLAVHDRVARDRDQRDVDAARERAIAAVPGRWEGCQRRSPEGEAFLRMRGIDPTTLIARDVVRFHRNGDVVVRLFDLTSGKAINLVTRHRASDATPKVRGLACCPTLGSLVGRVGEIGEGYDVCVLTEGVMDTLAAAVTWPTCIAVGAHGAGRIAAVAAAAAPYVATVRGWMLVVPDVDGDTGEKAVADAVRRAIHAGLVLDQSIHLVDVRPAKDLADAVRDGWRWSWPS